MLPSILKENPFKIELTHLQFYKGNPFTLFGKKKSTLKFCLKFTGKSLYKIFLQKNPCKIDSLFRKVVNFTKEIPLKFFSEKNYPQISPNFSRKIDKLDTIFSKTLSTGCFWKFLKISPTSPNYQNHKNIVVHFFIPMLLLPQTPTLIYEPVGGGPVPPTDFSRIFTLIN